MTKTKNRRAAAALRQAGAVRDYQPLTPVMSGSLCAMPLWQSMQVASPLASEVECMAAARFELPRTDVLPVTYIVDAEGKLRERLVGEQTSAGLLAHLERLRGE